MTDDPQALSQEVWELHLQDSMEEARDLRTARLELGLERDLVIVLQNQVAYMKAELVLAKNELSYYMGSSLFQGP